jgi:hypothetical protein
MAETRKITVEVPSRVLETAQEFTGEGVTETVRQALEELSRRRAGEKLRALRGKVVFEADWRTLRGKDEE